MAALKKGFQLEREWLKNNPSKVGTVDNSGGDTGVINWADY